MPWHRLGPIASGPVVHETHDLIVDLGDHREVLSFDVTQSPFFPIVLGVRWLSTHDPNITWSTRSIVFDSEYCRYHCRMQIPKDKSRLGFEYKPYSGVLVPVESCFIPRLRGRCKWPPAL